MSNFDEFLKKSQNIVQSFNNADTNYLIRQESEKLKDERSLMDRLSSVNYIQEFTDFLSNIEQHYVGKMLSFDYNETQFITNDDLLLKSHGFPKSSFLIATLKSFEKLEGIEHFILLSVNNFSKMEDDGEVKLAWVKHNKQTNLSGGLQQTEKTKRESIIDNQLKHMNYMSFSCHVLGMFYRTSDHHFAFSSQTNLVLSPVNYFILKPNEFIKNIIINHSAIEHSFNKNQDFKNFPIGKFRETESDVFSFGEKNPDVLIDLNVFRGKRTGFFGKTRLGKSNNAKIILSEFIKDNSRITNNKLKDKTGVVVFDENGEYANTNNQDHTSIYEKYKETGYVQVYSINKKKKDNLLLNFYINPNETMDILSFLLSGHKSIYVESFLTTDFWDTNKIGQFVERNHGNPIKLNEHEKIKFQLFWAMLYKAGYLYDGKVFFDYFNQLIVEPFSLSVILMNDLADYYQNEGSAEQDIFDDLKILTGDSDEAKFHKMCQLIDLFMELYIYHPETILKQNKRKYLFIETLLEMFNTTNKAGYKLLRRFKDFHSEKTTNNINSLVDDICDKAMIAIIDLSSTTNLDVKKYYAQRITSHIFQRLVYYFTENLLSEKPAVLGYYEEAHNLFPIEDNKGSIYYKLAKEGAKYNFSMIYVTQSPSNISQELLVQTENFFIGHLSAPKEIKALNALTYAYSHLNDDILRIKRVGLMKMFTDNHRFPISVQINKFV